MNARANAVYRDAFFLFRCFHRPPTPAVDAFYSLQESRSETERAIERGAERKFKHYMRKKTPKEHRNKNSRRASNEGQAFPSAEDYYLCVFSQVFVKSPVKDANDTDLLMKGLCLWKAFHPQLFVFAELIWIFKGPAVIFTAFSGQFRSGN